MQRRDQSERPFRNAGLVYGALSILLVKLQTHSKLSRTQMASNEAASSMFHRLEVRIRQLHQSGSITMRSIVVFCVPAR